MSISLESIKNLPDSPGVYFFKKAKENNGDILYIGKATSLRDRVKSYLSKDLLKTRSMLIADMAAVADTVEYQTTDSVLEALVLEAELIKKYQPYYNSKEKDDKSFIYVVITKEDFPVISMIRKRDLDDAKVRGTLKIKYEYGPFSSGPSLREGLKIIRRIFPYRDEKCQLNSGKPCFNYQIGLCPGTCIDCISKKDYSRTIRNISLFFQGKKGELVRKLKTEMNENAKAQKFEEANVIKRQIFALEHIRDVSLIKKENTEEGQEGARHAHGRPFRIEAYDIAHMQGGSMTGVMVVVEEGIAKKEDYRMFKIRRIGINDTASLKEVLTRRLGHLEWELPQLIVVDGGAAQMNAAKEILDLKGFDINLVAVTKDERHRPKMFIGMESAIEKWQKSILLANAEAHRFTLKYHRKLRSKNMFGK
jgi:excinuclease UvrABC nuclease subunit